jgi:predicted transcriptional regulator
MTRRSRPASSIERRLDALEAEQSDDPKSIAEILAEVVDREEP